MKVLVLLIFVCCACTSKSRDYVYYESFPREESLSGEVVELPGDLLCAYPYQIEIRDSIVLIFDRESPSRAVHKLSYPGFEWISSYGEKGKGDKEYIYLSKMDVRGDELYLLDPVCSKFLVYDLGGNDLYPKRVEKFKPVSEPLLFATVIDDSVIVSGDIGSRRFLLFQTFSGELIDSVLVKEKTEKEDSELPVSSLFDLKMSYDQQDCLAAVTKSGEVVYVYNTKTKQGNCIVGPDGFPDFGRSDDGHVILGKVDGFQDVKVYGDYIYAIYSGVPVMEAVTSNVVGGKYVYVFDKKGAPVVKYVLDRAISCFCVDVDSQVLYGIDMSSENFVVKYKLL